MFNFKVLRNNSRNKKYKLRILKGTLKLMGMSASQARLLSITARLTDNENSGQSLSYAKQRLADETEQINAEYNAALEATKLTVLTGYNGSTANYTDISYGLMTGYDTVACGKQYVITDTKGKVLVTKELAKAFESGNGSYNEFLAALGYTQCDIDTEDTDTANQKVHEAWDKYLKAVGLSFYDDEHGDENPNVTYGYTSFSNEAFDGYATYTINGQVKALNYEGTTKEQRELYDYAVALTEAVNNKNSSSNRLQTPAKDMEVANKLSYYKNIFNKMASAGYYTEANEADTIKDNKWFEQQLKEGKLLLQYYSATDRDFKSTSLSEDDAIQEVSDERQIAMVEAKYTQDTAALENKDQKIDLELKKLDSEHNALQTEYDSVKNVIDKNVENSFKTFG